MRILPQCFSENPPWYSSDHRPSMRRLATGSGSGFKRSSAPAVSTICRRCAALAARPRLVPAAARISSVWARMEVAQSVYDIQAGGY